ncbi:MAG: hypothetical protein LUC43_03600 [Burkholderiales bacterium]|nr:hypothetical protein [Burkholderiales bacterium]
MSKATSKSHESFIGKKRFIAEIIALIIGCGVGSHSLAATTYEYDETTNTYVANLDNGTQTSSFFRPNPSSANDTYYNTDKPNYIINISGDNTGSMFLQGVQIGYDDIAIGDVTLNIGSTQDDASITGSLIVFGSNTNWTSISAGDIYYNATNTKFTPSGDTVNSNYGVNIANTTAGYSATIKSVYVTFNNVDDEEASNIVGLAAGGQTDSYGVTVNAENIVVTYTGGSKTQAGQRIMGLEVTRGSTANISGTVKVEVKPSELGTPETPSSIYGVWVSQLTAGTGDKTSEINAYVDGGVNIEVISSNQTSSGSSIYGAYAGILAWEVTIGKDGSNGDIITITTSSSDDSQVVGFYQCAGKVNVYGNTEIDVSNSTDASIEGAYIVGGTYSQTGATTLNLTNVSGSSGIVAGTFIGDSYPSTDDEENATTETTGGPTSVELGGSTSVNLTTSLSDSLSDNIYGIAVASGVDNLNAGDLTASQAITVNIFGSSIADLGQTGTIYGFVAANGKDYTGVTGATELNFGNDSNTFTGIDYKGSFANFDTVNVGAGSYLMMFQGEQNALQGNDAVFGDSTPESTDTSVIKGVVAENGKLTINDSTLSVSGSTTPKFTIGSNALVATSEVDSLGDLTNNGGVLVTETLTMDSKSSTGTNITTSGTVLAKTLDAQKGFYTSSAGKLYAAELTMSGTVDDTVLDLTGTDFLVPDTVTWTDTTLGESGVTINAYGATLSGGALKLTNSTGQVSLNSSEDSPMNAKVYVASNSTLGLGAATTELSTYLETNPTSVTANTTVSPFITAKGDFSMESIPSGSLVLSTPVTTGDTGYIQVGGNYEDPVGLDFESGSNLILTSDLYTDDSAIAFTKNDGEETATISVHGGANLYVAVSDYSGADYYVIAKNYAIDEANDPASNWENYKTVLSKYGFNWSDDYEVRDVEDDEGTSYVILYRTAETQDDFCSLGYVACNNIKTDVEDPSQPGPGIVNDIVGDPDVDTADKVRVMNSIANLPFAGGVIGTAMDGLNGAITDIFNHLTMDSDTFGAHGVMWPYEEYGNMWLDVHGTWFNQKHLSASGISRAGWRANAFGFILGYDRKLKERPVAIGGAFSFTGGNVKSTGNISYTKNKYQEYGLHLWSNYSPNEHLNIIGALHWMHNVSDVTQNVGIAGYNKAQGHMTTDWFALGVRFETSLSAGKFTFVPHIEPRYVYAKMRDFDTKIDGTSIWRTHAKGNSFFQIPLGIAARADFLTESGWTIRPNADVTITPQAGSTKLRTQLRNVYNAVDAVEGEFMGKFQTAVKLGVQFDRKNWTLGGKYGLVAGDRGKLDHGFILQLRLRY